MSFIPPFLPESREKEGTLQDRMARARKAREEAAARIADLYANLEPDKRRWRTREELELEAEPLYIR